MKIKFRISEITMRIFTLKNQISKIIIMIQTYNMKLRVFGQKCKKFKLI